MRPVTQTYLLSDNLTRLTLDNDKQMALFDAGDASMFSLNFDCLADLADIAKAIRDKRTGAQVPQATASVTIHSNDGSESPGRLVPRMPKTRPIAEAPAQAAPVGLEAKDLATASLYVVTLDGRFYKRPLSVGQGTPFSYCSEATLFESAEAALPVAQTFPGAEIKLFSDVGEYRIAIVLPDGQVRFYKGNGFEPSAHVNDSMLIVSRASALSQLSTVQAPAGCRAFLLPNLA